MRSNEKSSYVERVTRRILCNRSNNKKEETIMKKATVYKSVGSIGAIILAASLFLQAGIPVSEGAKTVAAAAATAAPAASTSAEPSASAGPSAAPTQEPAISVMDAPIEERVTRNGLIYEYTGLTARLIGCTDAAKDRTSLTIPSRICVNDIYYDVTIIDCDALQGCTELQKVTIGRYVKQIRTGAFEDDTELAKVIFQGKKLDSVGGKAFKNTSPEIIFRIPSTVLKKYKKKIRSGSPWETARYRKK
jgi:hypothetical protein